MLRFPLDVSFLPMTLQFLELKVRISQLNRTKSTFKPTQKKCSIFILQKCSETKLSEMPQSYFTFARTLPPSSKISKSVMALLERFGWNKVLVIVGRRNEWIQIKDAIKVCFNPRSFKNLSTINLSFAHFLVGIRKG